MFASKERRTVIAEGLKIEGRVTAEGLVEVNGQIEGELHCTSLLVSHKGQIVGTIQAERVVVDGTVEGPIEGGSVWFSNRGRASWEIFITNLLPLSVAPPSMVVRRVFEATGEQLKNLKGKR